MAWLDVAKDTRPAKIVHRMHDFLSEAETGMSPSLHVEKVMIGKLINVGGQKVGFTLKGAWVWTRRGMGRYTEEQRDMAKAYAEDE